MREKCKGLGGAKGCVFSSEKSLPVTLNFESVATDDVKDITVWLFAIFCLNAGF